MSATTARSRAIASQDESIARNVAAIEAQRAEAPKPRNALQVLAGRLNLSPGALEGTLRNTVFKNCSNDEFVALVIVANEYNLNPLTKEIYAFAAKGGGIVPLVSVDGWVRIMNDHPQFDGIEFNDIVDESGKLYAIESVVYRKDRTRPVKVTEYMDECKRPTDPWNKTPNRMLRHRALIQGARYAFGFSGIYADGDNEIVTIGEPVPGARDVTPPTRAQTAQASIPHNPDTGEILDDETLARLDRDSFRQMEGAEIVSDAQEGRDDSERGEQLFPEPKPEPKRTAAGFVDDMIAQFNFASSGVAIQQIITDNADEIERLETGAPRQHARLMEARDLAWDQFNG